MDSPYDPSSVEKKWQKKWEEKRLFSVDLKKAKNPYYTHVMFPYPSGDKLHVGHWYNFGPADTFARFMRMHGKDVFSPIGFDAFGLPAENFAIKTGVHPNDSITKNVGTMIKQLKRIGCMYDWEKAVNTSTPEYYKWTQWLFIQMFTNNIAYRKEATVNFCPHCQTVLANEQVWDGCCERCETEVVLKPLLQWFWKITDYAQRLLDGLEDLDWPEKTKTMQRNWIGRSEGVNLKQKIKGLNIEVSCYDSVPQTFMAQTFAVIAAEHPLIKKLVEGTQYEKQVLEFVEGLKRKKAMKRFDIDEDMEGIFTGRYIDDPFGTGDLPLWIASFVVMDYGSGMVNCSAHDERDFAFAKKYDIPLRPVMFPEDTEEAKKVRYQEYCYSRDPQGILEQPKEFKGRRWGEVRADVITYMDEKGLGERAVQYKIRDWSIGRQRYWGAPIPIVYDPDGNPHAVKDEHLPWILPDDVEFKPTGTAPLAQSAELKKRTEKLYGPGWTPEVDTMDTFVCSSFYSYRYLAEGNQKDFVPKDIEKNWMPVDCYIGGAEHACMHLIYARFVAMVLKDLGHVTTSEQYKRLVHQGVITNQGAKMSKSKGNVVSPDSFIETYGSDVFRMYLMFMGPFTEGADWSDTGIKGIDRFVQRIWRYMLKNMNTKIDQDDPAIASALHQSIKKVTNDLERLHFNTAISSLMELLNVCEKGGDISKRTIQKFILLLSPLAPHLAEELWGLSGGKGFAIEQSWPLYDEKILVKGSVTIGVQVNGKVRGQIDVSATIDKLELLLLVKEIPNVKKHLEGKTINKELVIEGKLVSIVVT